MTPRSGVAASAAVLILLLVACGSDVEGPSGGGSAESAPEDATAPDATTSSSDGSSETAEAQETPDVAPAAGKVIEVEGLRVNAPEGWVVSDRMTIQQGAAPPTAFGTLLTVYRFPNSGLFTIDELGDDQRRYEMGAGARRLEDLEVDGQQVYHLTARPERGSYVERFGTIADDDQLSVEFMFANGESRTVRDEITQSVLATAEIG